MRARKIIRHRERRRGQALAVLCLSAAIFASAVPSASATPLAGPETRQVSHSGSPLLLPSATLSPVADDGAPTAAQPPRSGARLASTSLAAASGTHSASGAAAADASANNAASSSSAASEALHIRSGSSYTSFMSSASRTRGQPTAA